FLVVRFIRGQFQKYCIDEILRAETPYDQLVAYATATFSWLKDFPEHARVWLLFYYYCGIRKEFRQLNSDLVNQGHERITALLRRGIEAGEFKIDGDVAVQAKLIQNTLTGGLLVALTEESGGAVDAEDSTRALCLQLAGAAKLGKLKPKRQ